MTRRTALALSLTAAVLALAGVPALASTPVPHRRNRRFSRQVVAVPVRAVAPDGTVTEWTVPQVVMVPVEWTEQRDARLTDPNPMR